MGKSEEVKKAPADTYHSNRTFNNIGNRVSDFGKKGCLNRYKSSQ